MKAAKFHIATFGCRTNQADSAAIREDFLGARFSETDDWREADVIVVNSCTVTHRSDQQVRQLVRRLRRENQGARLVVTGCYAQRDPDRISAIPGVDVVVGNTRKTELVQITTDTGVDAVPPGPRELAVVYRDDFARIRSLDLTAATQLGGRTRPFVKIQDGCDAKCTYCIIPAVRGPSRSVPPQQILSQVRDLVKRGFQEIVLTGIHIGTYGMHLHPRHPLDRLLEEMLGIAGLGRVRISSIEPMELSRRVIRLAAGSGGAIAPHFHICLQSGADTVLKRMLRPYDTFRFAGIVEEIRALLPEAGIGTDVIAGFPGETEEEHSRTLEFVEKMPFTYLHVFPYSDRSGTAASGFSGKVDRSVVKRRAAQLRKLSRDKNRRFQKEFLGRRLSMITLDEIEAGRRGVLTGNYLKGWVDPSIPANRIVELEAVSVGGERLAFV